MSTELAEYRQSELSLLPAQQPPSTVARQMLLAHAEMMQTAHQLAVAMCDTAMVPVRFRGKPDDGAAAILYGAELGLNPIQSLQRIIPIHGMPSLEARTMVALLTARGYRIRTVNQSDTSVTVCGALPTSPDVYEFESTWTIERAIQAGYVPEIDPKTGKYKTNSKGNLQGNEKYITDPQAMLKAKAQAEVCRDMAPDVLMGISYTTEELESERFDSSALPPAPADQRRPAPVTVDEIMGSATSPAEEPKPKRTRKPKAEPPQDAEVVDEPSKVASENGSKPEPSQVSATAGRLADDMTPDELRQHRDEQLASIDRQSELRQAARQQLSKAIFATFGEVGLGKDENREDRLIVVEAIVGRRVESTKDLSDDELQKLRNALIDRKRDGVLEDDINEWLNAAAFKEAMAEESAAEAAANETNTEGN